MLATMYFSDRLKLAAYTSNLTQPKAAWTQGKGTRTAMHQRISNGSSFDKYLFGLVQRKFGKLYGHVQARARYVKDVDEAGTLHGNTGAKCMALVRSPVITKHLFAGRKVTKCWTVTCTSSGALRTGAWSPCASS